MAARLRPRRALLLAVAAVTVALSTLIALAVQPYVAPIASTPPPVDAQRLAAHVRHLSLELYPRSHDQFANLERAAAYVEREFIAAGALGVQSQPVRADEAIYRNVIARFGPSDGPLLVIGAHLDSHGDAHAGATFGTKGHDPSTHTPGADDNASGVAGLIELARLLAANPPRHAVELVAYTLEVPPHFRTAQMGSVTHARSLRAAGREVRLMVSLEMIGYFSDAPGSQRFPLPGLQLLYPDRGDFIAIVSRWSTQGDFAATRRAKALMRGATALPVRSINAPPVVAGIDFSDHLAYWAQGMPALMVTDTSFMRNPHYHRAGDTHDTLDYRRMAQVVQGVYALVQGY